MGLSGADLRHLLRYLDELVWTSTMSDIEMIVLPGLASLISATLVIYHFMAHLTEPVQIDIGWPPDLFTAPNLRPYSSLAAEHPLIQHLGRIAQNDPLHAFAVSDLVPDRTWRSSAVYREALRPLGGDDQMAIILRVASDQVEALSLTRHAGKFLDRDRELLERARPHIAVAITRARQGSLGSPALQVRPDIKCIIPGEGVPSFRLNQLSNREAEVMTLVAAGLSNSNVARRLGTSPRTVSKHLENIFRKLGVSSRTAAVARFDERFGTRST